MMVGEGKAISRVSSEYLVEERRGKEEEGVLMRGLALVRPCAREEKRGREKDHRRVTSTRVPHSGTTYSQCQSPIIQLIIRHSSELVLSRVSLHK